MIQRMLNRVAIEIPEIDMTSVFNIEVTFEQKSSGTELTYGEENISVVDEHNIIVTIPKEDAMLLDKKLIRGQVMYMRDDETPDATEIFTTTVDELLKEEGYGD